jgi:WD40 repeat protein
VWNVTDPPRAARIATLSGPRDFIQAIAFSPRGNLLAGVTYHGTVLVFSLAGPARPALTATISGILAEALYPDGRLRHPHAPPCPLCSPASYAVAFTPDGRTLTVVVDRQEANVIPTYSNVSRDTVFTWNVTSSGALSGLTTAVRDVKDLQPAHPGPQRPHRGRWLPQQQRGLPMDAALTCAGHLRRRGILLLPNPEGSRSVRAELAPRRAEGSLPARAPLT